MYKLRNICGLIAILIFSTVSAENLNIESEFTYYPGSKVINIVEEGDYKQIVLNCGNAAINDVYNYYKDKILDSAKWSLMLEIKSDTSHQLMVEKKDYEGFIGIVSEDNETGVVLMVNKIDVQ
jgi:hypothetical protein